MHISLESVHCSTTLLILAVLACPLYPHCQVGLVIVVFEYERQRRNDILKRQKEAAERRAVLEQAQREREVRGDRG